MQEPAFCYYVLSHLFVLYIMYINGSFAISTCTFSLLL